MTKRISEDNNADDRLAEAQARIEALEAAAADAEALSATALEELSGVKQGRLDLETQLAEAVVARETAEGELARTIKALDRVQAARTRSEAGETRNAPSRGGGEVRRGEAGVGAGDPAGAGAGGGETDGDRRGV